MKKKSITLALAAITALAAASTSQAAVLAYWNFNVPGDNGATSGTGTLNATTGAGTLTWSGNSANLAYFGGTVTNMQDGDDRGVALALQNGTSGENNGSFLEFTLDLTSLTTVQSLVMTFAAQRTSTGFDTIMPSYAVGAGSFTDLAEVPTFESSMGTTTAIPGAIRTIDFASVNSSIAGESDVRIRLTLDGGSTTSSAGNNRFDNVTFTAVPEPSAALLGGLGFLALLRRRR